MKNRSNALLVELLIVVLFFMLAATVLLQVFSGARAQSRQAGLLTQALNEAQNTADQLILAPRAHETLADMGFVPGQIGWAKEMDGFSLVVTAQDEKTAAGMLHYFTVQASAGDNVLITLPAARYEEVQP